jgi:hypothetical protein
VSAVRRKVAILLAVGLCLGATLLGGVGQAQGAAGHAPSRAGDGPWTLTKTLTRVFTNADGTTYSFPSHKVTVSVDHTQNLRSRERVKVSWTGAQPSAGRASNPYGENGLLQEYPVVIMECRGLDDPNLPPAKQLSPDTCWSGSVAERSQVTRSDSEAPWIHDLYADPADKGRLSGMSPFPGADVCATADTPTYYTHLTPFVAAKGTVYPACDATHMPPEAAVGAAFPPNELAAFTDKNGTGSVQFEVRTDVENESLGCSHKVACSIVVIPINGLSCDQPASPPTNADTACRKGGQFLPGSSNFANQGVDQAVSPALWWSASNWRNRFSIPISFGLPPDTCDVLDPRAPTGFYGSELLAEAALQWAPAYCLNKQRFKFQMNVMSDDAGWNLMESGGGPAAEVSSRHAAKGPDPVGYAPSAVTGFSIGYVIDKPDNAGEYTSLRLNARLLAKLMTESYLGSDLGRGHPGMSKNPLSLVSDPEFAKLNPGLGSNDTEAAATLLSLSISSDVIQQLTDYIAHDKKAMAFINGKPDPWGMVVNPAYKKIAMPTPEWPLLDTYVPQTQNVCRQKNPGVYFSQLAAPVSTMSTIATALLDSWPNVQTRCDFDVSTQSYKLGRIDPESYGSRFMLGVVSLGDAARYGLRSAALETKPGTYVAPDDSALAAAVKLAKQSKPGQPFTMDMGALRRSGKAYPGSMIVYTAAKLSGLDKADATKVAQFMKVSSTQGQKRGSGNGELPQGFLPIVNHGVTKPLYASAQLVSREVAAQKPAPPTGHHGPSGPSGPPHPPVTTGHTSTGTTTTGPVAGAPPTSTTPSPYKNPTKGTHKQSAGQETTLAAPMPPTQAVSSRVSRGLIPMLVLLGFLGLGVSSATRFFVRPPRGTR